MTQHNSPVLSVSENDALSEASQTVGCNVSVKELLDSMQSLGDGNYSERIRPDAEGNMINPELDRAFNEMAEKLEKRNNDKNDFLSGVAHDLRSPMTSIIGFIDGILDGAIEKNDEEKYLNIVRDECMRLSGLVTELLDISRMQAGDRKFVMKAFDICEKARTILIGFEQRIEEKKLDVEFSCDSHNMSAYGDSDAIHRVLYNICDNAVKFSRPGGKYRIEIGYTDAAESRIKVSVFNQGDGIPEKDLAHVFERFYRSDKTVTASVRGTGLGLYIAKLIIDAHGGEIFAESVAGEWCKISFVIPAAEAGT